MPPLFAAEGFDKHFGDRRVLKSASIWARPGRITALLGRNGSGKSTLLRCALGLVATDHGVVHFDGESYERPSLARFARRGLMFVPVESGLVRGRTMRSQLDALRWRFRGPISSEDAAARLGLAGLLDQWTDELSGGELRRAGIAAAVVRQPRCLLTDEPLAGISPRDADAVCVALSDLAAAGCGIVVTGHEVRMLMDLADDIVWMYAGTTHGIGSPAEARSHDQFRREYLGPAA